MWRLGRRVDIVDLLEGIATMLMAIDAKLERIVAILEEEL